MLSNLFEEIGKYNPRIRNKNYKKKEKEGFGIINYDGSIPTKSKNWTLESSILSWDVILILIFLVITFLFFTIRTISIQIIKQDKYLALARENKIREIAILPERGVIFDQKDNPLARNKPAFSIQLNLQVCSPDMHNLNECINTVNKLSDRWDIKFDKNKVIQDINNKKVIIIVADGLEKGDILPIESKITELPGMSVLVQPVREYVYGEQFSHILGYIGLDEIDNRPVYKGKTGIEKQYNSYLSGIPGVQIVQVDSTGTNYKVISQEDTIPGKNVHTYLDLKLQNKTFEVLKDKIENGKPDIITGFKAEAGAIIAQDPKTGGILALVSYPSYNPNILISGVSTDEYKKFSEDPKYPFYNRAIGAAYPPGSVFKMIIASGALMENVVTPNTTIIDKGYIQVGAYTFKNWNTAGHGEVNMKRALQVSNDTYFYTVGGGYGQITGLGIEKLHEWANKFGIGKLTGIDIDGEVGGFMPNGRGREWYLGDTYITSIGQGDVLVTPLQINNITSYFANGGHLMVPKITKSIDGVGDIQPEEIKKDLVNEDFFNVINSGLIAAVNPGGTAFPLYDFSIRHKGVELAGKTGTAEYIDSEGKARTHAWFTVYGPVEDASISLTVFLEGGGEGSGDAAPLAKEILDTWFESQ